MKRTMLMLGMVFIMVVSLSSCYVGPYAYGGGPYYSRPFWGPHPHWYGGGGYYHGGGHYGRRGGGWGHRGGGYGHPRG